MLNTCLMTHLALQADLRHQWSKAEAKNAARTIDADETIGNTLLNIGGIFRFGAPAPVVAEAAPRTSTNPSCRTSSSACTSSSG